MIKTLYFIAAVGGLYAVHAANPGVSIVDTPASAAAIELEIPPVTLAQLRGKPAPLTNKELDMLIKDVEGMQSYD